MLCVLVLKVSISEHMVISCLYYRILRPCKPTPKSVLHNVFLSKVFLLSEENTSWLNIFIPCPLKKEIKKYDPWSSQWIVLQTAAIVTGSWTQVG